MFVVYILVQSVTNTNLNMGKPKKEHKKKKSSVQTNAVEGNKKKSFPSDRE